jgi:hypothetical protein
MRATHAVLIYGPEFAGDQVVGSLRWQPNLTIVIIDRSTIWPNSNHDRPDLHPTAAAIAWDAGFTQEGGCVPRSS